VTTFEAIAEPTRRRILDLLQPGETPVGSLVDELSLSQPAVSKHLRVLREAGLVTVRVDAQRRYYRLHAAGLAEIDAWLTPYRGFWMPRPKPEGPVAARPKAPPGRAPGAQTPAAPPGEQGKAKKGSKHKTGRKGGKAKKKE
jgi:DNA-binding transcriptional ArsR family regulator